MAPIFGIPVIIESQELSVIRRKRLSSFSLPLRQPPRSYFQCQHVDTASNRAKTGTSPIMSRIYIPVPGLRLIYIVSED